MTVLDDVFGSLQQMTLVQLLFGFLTCTCYSTLQGRLFGGRVRRGAGTVAVLSAFGFVLAGTEWVYGVMLLTFTIGALGVFAAMVWLLGHCLGFNGRRAPRVRDSTFPDTTSDELPPTSAVLAGRPVASAHLAANSR